MPAVVVESQLGLRFDLERDPVESAEILEHDFEVGVKITGQLIRPEDLESTVVGARFRHIERATTFPSVG